MPLEGASIHATAVAIDRCALLILGAARRGKSSLAWEIMAAAPAHAALIADDRVLLTQRGECAVARPHPRIAGFIERRGIGFVALPWVEQARVVARVDLGGSHAADGRGIDAIDTLLRDLPCLDLAGSAFDLRCRGVLRWWDFQVRAGPFRTASPWSGRDRPWGRTARDAKRTCGTLEVEDWNW